MFGSSKKDEQSVLLCTIESGAVHASLCLMHPSNKPFIVHSATKPIAFQEEMNFERFASVTLQALADACQEIVTKGVPHVSSRRVRKGHIDAVYCIYSSPWYASQTRHVDIRRPKPILVTERLILDLAREYGAPQSLLSLADAHDAPKMLTQDIIGVHLNGYPVHNPYNKKADRISFSIIAGAISQSFSKYVEDVVGRFFSQEQFFHHAGPAMLFLGIRDTLASDDSFLAVDVSGELTDVSVIRDGVLVETISFPSGVRTGIRLFSEHERILPTEVFGIMQGIRDKKLDTIKQKEYESGASMARAKWSSAFAQALLPYLATAPLPKKAFLFGDSGEFARVKSILIPTDLTHPQTGETIDVTPVLAENLSSFCVTREGVRLGHPLVPLSALYVHRLLTMKNAKTR